MEVLNGGKLLEGLYKLTDSPVRAKIDYNLNLSILADVLIYVNKSHKAYEEAMELVSSDAEMYSEKFYKVVPEIEKNLLDALEEVLDLMNVYAIMPDDVTNYYEALLKERGIHETYMEGEPLATSFRYAVHCNIYDYQLGNTQNSGLRTHVSDGPLKYINFKVGEALKEDLFELMGKIIALWDKYNDTTTQEHQKEIMVIWLMIIKMLALIGFEAKSLYIKYEKFVKGEGTKVS